MNRTKAVMIAIALALGILLPYLSPYEALASEVLVFALFAVAYDLVLGYAGMLSFGQAAFFGIGAYTVGIVLLRLSSSVLIALLAGCVTASVAALLIGYACIRSRGIYFTMVTLAFAQMIYFIAFKWSSLTGGSDGLHGVPRPTVGSVDLASELNLYYFILVFVIIGISVIALVVNSPLGKALQAIRENRDRAESIGYNVNMFRLLAFVISGFFTGLAGGLFVLLQSFAPLSSLYWTTTGEAAVMTITGGMGTLVGPIIGAVLIILLRDIISAHTEMWNLFMGLMFMAVVLGFRGGIVGLLRDKLKLDI